MSIGRQSDFALAMEKMVVVSDRRPMGLSIGQITGLVHIMFGFLV